MIWTWSALRTTGVIDSEMERQKPPWSAFCLCFGQAVKVFGENMLVRLVSKAENAQPSCQVCVIKL